MDCLLNRQDNGEFDSPPGPLGGAAKPLVSYCIVSIFAAPISGAGVLGYNRYRIDWHDTQALMPATIHLVTRSFVGLE